jgi:hypothetical protein
VEERSLESYGGQGSSLVVNIPRAEAVPGGSPAEAADRALNEAPAETFILGIPRGEEGPPFSYALETGLRFIRLMLEDPPDRPVLAAFLGDEGSGDAAHRALEDLYFLLEDPENVILLYLDLDGPPERLLIHHGVRGDIAPLALVQPFLDAGAVRGIPCGFAGRFNEFYKLGLVQGPSALEYAYALDFPALLLRGGAPGEAQDFTPNDAPEKALEKAPGEALEKAAPAAVETPAAMLPAGIPAETLAEFLGDYARRVSIGIGREDTHYSLFQYRERILVLPEGAVVFGILVMAGMGGLALVLFSGLRRAGFPRFRKREFIKNPGFYGALAMASAATGLLLGIFGDLSCAPAFLGALGFAIAGALVHFSLPVWICAALSLAGAAERVYGFLKIPGPRELFPPGYPVIPLSLLCLGLTFVFLVIRGILLIHHAQRISKRRVSSEVRSLPMGTEIPGPP